MLTRPLLLAVLVAVPVGALTVTLPSQGIHAESTASLATDATGGSFTLYAPVPDTSCREATTTGQVPADGVLGGLGFDRAGAWALAITQDGTTEEARVTVQPRPIQIHATPQASGRLTDYLLEVREGSQTVPRAYIDVYHGASFIRHARSDPEGRFLLSHDALPYAGTYTVNAYRGNNQASPTPRDTDYPQAFTFQTDPVCGAIPAYDEPEQYGIGPVDYSITRLADPLDLYVDGAYQVHGIRGAANVTLTTTDGQAAQADTVQLLVDGIPTAPSDLNLNLTQGPGFILLQGSWTAGSDVVVYAEIDRNHDGQPDAIGQTTIMVSRDLPIRFEVVGNETLSYQVPPRDATGRPGTHVLRFRLLDLDGNEGRPPQIPESSIRVEGDLLGTPLVTYDAGAHHWQATATPLGSDARYTLTATWLGKGTLRTVIQLPPDGGATANLTAPTPPLVAGVQQDIKIQVYRYNRAADEGHLCTPTPTCAYEAVTDATAELFWTDTGQPVRGPNGAPYRFDPQGPTGACQCFELAGTYYFQGVRPDRSGTMAAFATVSGNGPVPRHAYANLPVAPRPAFDPGATPNVVLAGEVTRIHLTAPGLDATTRSNYDIRVLDQDHLDVTRRGTFQTIGGQLYWTATLPTGTYQAWIAERLDIEHGLRGLNGTQHPALIESRPALVRFQLTDPTFQAALSDVGDLRIPRQDTYVLGSGFGAIQHLTVTVHRPDGNPAQGRLTLTSHQAEAVSGLLAPALDTDPPRLGGPQLFPPGEPRFIAQDGVSYYLVETGLMRNFTADLTLPITGRSLGILAWGTGLGNTTATFHSTTSNLNEVAPAVGSIHFIAPQGLVQGITTPRGQARSNDLALGEQNLVTLRVRDPTGLNRLEGIEVGFTREIFGPSQRPSGILHYANATYGSATIGIQPDATGALSLVAVTGPATTTVDAATQIGRPLRINVVAPPQIQYTSVQGQQGHLSLDMPVSVLEDSRVDLRIRSNEQALPNGTVEAFGGTYAFTNGTLALRAPVVNRSTDYAITVRVPGYLALTRALNVHDSAPAALPAVPTLPPPMGGNQTPEPGPAQEPGSGEPANGTETPPVPRPLVHRTQGLKDLLADPTVFTLALLVGGGALGYPILLAIQKYQKRKGSSVTTYQEAEEDAGQEDPDEVPVTPSPASSTAPEVPSEPAPEPIHAEPKGPVSPLQEALEDPDA